MNDNKIYCKDCRYFVLAVFNDYAAWSDYCNAPTGNIRTDFVYGNYKERVLKSPKDKGYPNKRDSNGCKFYRRKWWKFWIKEKR